MNDGVLCPTEFVPETAWAYTDLEVNARQLVRWFHPAEGKALRFGDEVIVLEPEAPRAETSAEAPQAKSSAEAAVPRNLGGRPQDWEWEAAINATWAAIYYGKLDPKRPKINSYMADWFSARHEEGHPHQSQIREKAKGMWLALIEANREEP